LTPCDEQSSVSTVQSTLAIGMLSFLRIVAASSYCKRERRGESVLVALLSGNEGYCTYMRSEGFAVTTPAARKIQWLAEFSKEGRLCDLQPWQPRCTGVMQGASCPSHISSVSRRAVPTRPVTFHPLIKLPRRRLLTNLFVPSHRSPVTSCEVGRKTHQGAKNSTRPRG
jgi:hypothetical protein